MTAGVLLGLGLATAQVGFDTDWLEPPVRARFVAALEAVAAGDDPAAVVLLGALADEHPEVAPVWIELSEAFRRTGRPAAALAAARRATEVAPDAPLPLLAEARAWLAAGRPAWAVESYRATLACAETLAVRMELAWLLTRLRRFEAAELELRAAVRHAPDSAVAHGALGRILARRKRYAESLAPFLRAEELGVAQPGVWVEHGRALERLARLEEALAVYRRATERFPDDARPWRRGAALMRELGDAAGAIPWVERALALEPSDVATMTQLGETQAAAGETAAAEATLRRVLRLAPDLKRAHYALGTLLAEVGRELEAQESLERFQQLHAAADDADHLQGKLATLNRQGLKLYREGRLLAAIEVFEAALALGPRAGSVHANLGLALLAAGNPEGALEAFAEARQRTGDSDALRALEAEARAAIAAR